MATMADRPPSRADGRGSFSVATYNVRCGRNAGLESALRAMAATEVDLGIFTETKITDSVYTRYSSGYNVTATNAVSASQGGIALFWRDNELYEIEEVVPRSPNVLTFELVTGQIRYFVVVHIVILNEYLSLLSAWLSLFSQRSGLIFVCSPTTVVVLR